MKVILKEYVYMHGVEGDIVDVADGYARNFLIPQGKAVRATEAAIEQNQVLLEKAAIRRAELNDQLVSVAERLDGTILVFGRKAGRNNKLYGSVTTADIADAILEKTDIDINRRRISERYLRELGEFDVSVRMSAELSPTVKVIIVPEEDLKETLELLESGIDLDEVVEEYVDEQTEYVDAEGNIVDEEGSIITPVEELEADEEVATEAEAADEDEEVAT